MRIPTEALVPLMNGIDTRAKDYSAERQRPEPVERLADLRPQLNQSSLAERRAAENEEAVRRAIQAAKQWNEARRAQGERRRAERRKVKQHVFLDTRLTRSRRSDAFGEAIDLEV
jgi:hypothetical protein